MNMTVVRIANLPAQVSYEDMHELVSLVEEPQSLNLAYAADGTRTCEVSCLFRLDDCCAPVPLAMLIHFEIWNEALH
jgi:hypothetical protein